mmetsp:Transcript_31350/g.99906  ORF Transcript_31350/g.99906 Transcript_31350/m.99906 type:complete len:274 (+) Transcript_31350:110-931(+)
MYYNPAYCSEARFLCPVLHHRSLAQSHRPAAATVPQAQRRSAGAKVTLQQQCCGNGATATELWLPCGTRFRDERLGQAQSPLPASSSSSSFSSPVMSASLSAAASSPPPCALAPPPSPLSAWPSACSCAASFESAPPTRRSAAARASSSSSSSTALRFLPGLSAVGQPALAHPTRSAGRGESHQIGPPSRPASWEAQEMQPVLTEGPVEPGFRKCSGTRQIAVVPKFELRLSMAWSEQRNSKPGFFHLAMSDASACFSKSSQSYNALDIAFFL